MSKAQENIGELGDIPNQKWQQFFGKFAEIDALKIEEWKPTHLLAYFCHKYQQTYQIKYQFKFNAPLPSKSFEVFQIKRLGVILTSRPNLLKEYIDWIFDNKIPQAKRRITSISFLTREEFVSEYKLNVLLADKKDIKINRATMIPTNYQQLFIQAGIDVKTYGDLAFLAQIPDKSVETKAAFSKLLELGFDPQILDQIV